MKKRMGCKACDESKPQQPVGCEDLDEEYNEADRLLFAPLLYRDYLIVFFIFNTADTFVDA